MKRPTLIQINAELCDGVLKVAGIVFGGDEGAPMESERSQHILKQCGEFIASNSSSIAHTADDAMAKARVIADQFGKNIR
jgi:hypothetical protein